MLLRLRLLGTFEVAREDGQAVEIASQGARALLVYLALEAGRSHEREHLASLLWPDTISEQALTNLRQALHRLRTALALSDDTPTLTVTRHSVRLDPAAVVLDTDSFVGHLRATAGHRHRLVWACDSCLLRLRAAVELYSGPLLPGFQANGGLPFEEWLGERRERLHHGQVAALDALAAHHGARGEIAIATDYLRRWLVAEPWCEEAHARLMGLLWRAGARAAALRQYERCRAALATELSSEPNFSTRALAEMIRRGALPPPAVPSYGPGALPIPATPFIGRAAELARLGAHLANPDCRLATLTGPSGIGKTRLAREAAAAASYAFAQGAVWVDLAAIRDDRLVAAAILEAMGLSWGQQRPAAASLAEALAECELLLVLDTCEHLPRCADLAADLLRAAPGVVILATSRSPLGLRAEWRMPLEGLAAPESGALFAAAARRAAPDF
ncbi:MAG: AAA family ATPase [Chloroflexales bacterium]|nr:AAA family ATPase [Chloroflexales bacterium]